jgi:hypothetical protein
VIAQVRVQLERDVEPWQGRAYQGHRLVRPGHPVAVNVGLTRDAKFAKNWLTAEESALESTFQIGIGTTVTPDSPRDAGDVATPGAQQTYDFHGKAGEVIEIVSHQPCSLSTINLAFETSTSLYGPGELPYGQTTLCGDIGPVRLQQTGQYRFVVNPLIPGFGASKIVEPYSFSLLRVPAVRAFKIKVGATVRPGRPRHAGRLSQPYTEQVFNFHGRANEKITVLSKTKCQPGTPGTLDVWAVSDGFGFPASTPLCQNLATMTLSATGTYTIAVNAGVGQNYFGQTDWGTQPTEGTFSFKVVKTG